MLEEVATPSSYGGVRNNSHAQEGVPAAGGTGGLSFLRSAAYRSVALDNVLNFSELSFLSCEVGFTIPLSHLICVICLTNVSFPPFPSSMMNISVA